MNKHGKITLTGQGHWSIRGVLESIMWLWWVEIQGVTISDEEMQSHMLQKEAGLVFIKELRQYLPISFQGEFLKGDIYVSLPDGIPGGTWDIKLPLSDCINPSEAEKIIQKYFPKLYELA